MNIRPVKMDFRYGASFGGEPPEAYERLQLDCMLGDATLFTRADEVEAAWTLIDPIIQHWQANPPQDFPNYDAGSWGPKAADELIGARRPCLEAPMTAANVVVPAPSIWGRWIKSWKKSGRLWPHRWVMRLNP